MRIGLPLEGDFIVMRGKFADIIEVSGLKVASEDGIADTEYFAAKAVDFTLFVDFLEFDG